MLLVLVLVLAALVPRGYMVAPSSDGHLEIVLCPSTNPLARAVQSSPGADAHDIHAAMGHTSDTDEAPAAEQSGASCDYAGAPFAGLAGGGPDIAPLGETLELPEAEAYRAFALTQQRRLRPPMRAPPVTA